ncbi:MAG: di-trans,poly-cis-decaprenylcistransferase [Eubacterium sp.]|nr:di-trans,poly-cis-decaprenylcistransferase [Eubacterium sp.]
MGTPPAHVGIIMDGNGRWAKKRGLPRTAGHSRGAKVFKRIVEDLRSLGVKYTTFYAFSTENWKRPEEEVNMLMKLLDSYLDDIRSMAQKNTRIIFAGDKAAFSPKMAAKMKEIEEISENNDGLYVCIALNYGGRAEIVHAAKLLAKEFGDNIDAAGEDDFDRLLYTSCMPSADLIIRTGGEQRLSNFLIWQSAYAELYFTDKLWPDFSKDDLITAFNWYSQRDRRFGGV